MTMSERVEILMGLVAPKARITWSGGPRGLLPHSLSVAATFTTLFVAHWAVLTYWLNPGRFLVHPSQWPKDDIPEAAMSWMVLVVCALGTIICLSGLLPLVWSRTREYRRTEYHVTSAGIFLAKGAHLVRYDLPEIEPGAATVEFARRGIAAGFTLLCASGSSGAVIQTRKGWLFLP